MIMEDIFQQKRKNWDSLIALRRGGGTAPYEEMTCCPKCGREFPLQTVRNNYSICPACRHYLPLTAFERIEMVCDKNSFRELFAEMTTADPLHFPGYAEKLEKNRKAAGLLSAFVGGVGRIRKKRVCIGVLDGRFLMGSMGTAVGEKITRLCEYAGKKKLPLIIFSASGGARMQEGLFSLMQMAKTAAAIERFKQEGGLFISYLTNPTTGGVSASYASLGDIILAEPDALICFAGPRVIEQTIGQKLPEGFQHAEFLQEHGMIDKIVERKNMRSLLAQLLRLHEG